MSEGVDRWIQTAELFTERHEAISEAQWADPTPCSEWNVAALVDHVVDAQARYSSLLGLTSGQRDWPAVHREMTSLLAEPMTMVGTVNHPALGELSKVQILDICTNDLLIHTWDLSRAIGAEESLPDHLVEACFDWLRNTPATGRSIARTLHDAVRSMSAPTPKPECSPSQVAPPRGRDKAHRGKLHNRERLTRHMRRLGLYN